MDLKQGILDWIARREAALRGTDRHTDPCRLSKAHAQSEERLSEVIAALDPRDVAPLSEAARLWLAAKRVSRFAHGRGQEGTGPCPEIAAALRAAESVLHVLATGTPGVGPDDRPRPQYFSAPKPDQVSDGSFEFLDRNRDTWVIRDCEEDAGCTVVERLHAQEVERAKREGSDPEPVQVIDVPPDLCRLMGHVLLARADRVSDQERRSR